MISPSLYALFFDGEPATLNATQGVKTPGYADFGEASLQTSLAVTTRPSAASRRPASPIHCGWSIVSKKSQKEDHVGLDYIFLQICCEMFTRWRPKANSTGGNRVRLITQISAIVALAFCMLCLKLAFAGCFTCIREFLSFLSSACELITVIEGFSFEGLILHYSGTGDTRSTCAFSWEFALQAAGA